jgi:manganese transport protein
MNHQSETRRWYHRIGPSLITACVVIGPGSILTSSTVGANQGYSMLWVVVVAIAFMLVYMTMGAKLGAVTQCSPADLIRKNAGRPLAMLVGGCVFFITAAFQAGNNIAVTATFESYFESELVVGLLLLSFNAIALLFLFAFDNLYRVLERLMIGFVAIMLISFAVNLGRLGPDPVAMAKGFVPTIEALDIAVLGLIGTTFVIAAAYYQAYLVQQKGWGLQELRSGIVDARIGSITIALITLMLMSTAAAGLFNGTPQTLANPVAVADALEPTFGAQGKLIFCLGLFSAAYSSFLVNSMIGGFILADGFELGSRPSDRWPRLLTAAVLMIGMAISLAVVFWNFDRTPTIIAAQALTVVVAPLVAGVLLWLTSSQSVMGEHANGPLTKGVAMAGFLILLAIAGHTAFVKIPAAIQQYLSPGL